MSVESHLESRIRDGMARCVMRFTFPEFKLFENFNWFSTIFFEILIRNIFTMRDFFFFADAILAER